MHQHSIVVAIAGIAVVIAAMVLPQAWIAPPAAPALVRAPAAHDSPKQGVDPARQSFADIQGVTQRFADDLGQLNEDHQTVSPAELARQANAEPSYPVSAVAEPARTLDAETIYVQARPGVVVVGGVYKCTKCQRWHVRCASGFVVRRDGLIVTNLHTIDAFKKLDAVGVMTAAGRVYPVLAVLAASRLNDLALLKVDAEDLPPLPIAKDVSVGAVAYCLSHPVMPGGMTNCFYTFSRGMVVGKFTLETDKGQSLKVLAVSNDYGSGSSGGPILNEHGAVVAVACQALPLLQPDHEKNVQMIWRFARPSCSILEMLSGTTRGAGVASARSAGTAAARKTGAVESQPAQTVKAEHPDDGAEPPAAGSATFELRPTDQIAVGYFRPVAVKLGNEPPIKPKAEPAYRSTPLYGVLQLGDADDNQILVALDEPDGGEPRLYIDRKGDGDLANSGPGQWDRTAGPTLFANVAIDVHYQTGKIPYSFSFYRFKSRNRDSLYYYRNSGREGEVVLEGNKYRVLVLDDNADGRFDDLENGSIIIDLNQDGTLEKTPDSAEYFRLNEPFNVHGKVWEVASVSPDGLSISLRPSAADVPIKPYLNPGYPAPEFSGEGLDGKPIDLKAEASKSHYLLLDFWASWCGPCRKEFATLHRVHEQYKGRGLRIIGVTLDSELSRAQEAAKQANLSYPHVFDGLGWKNAVAQLYRVHGIPQTYLLDSRLNIVAKNLRGPELERRLRELLGSSGK
jgi:thiol-disulfide isomerase/thioredoxin/S1-C subfamily serine protease